MTSHVKMAFQPPPHLPYVQGWPGILGVEPERKAPALHGTLELRVGSHQIKCKMILIELVRIEVLPGSALGQTVVTPVGAPITVWRAGEGKEYDIVESADYRFHIPLPLNIPPSVELPKSSGIKYELQANFHHKPKGGLLRKETKPIIQATQPIFIMKHELHSAWPVYNISETRNTIQEQMELTVNRSGSAFGHTDRVELNVSLKSSRPKPLKLRSFEVTLQEITTFRPPAAKGARQSALNRSKTVLTHKEPVNSQIGRGQEISRHVAFVVPNQGILLTVKGGKAIDIAYELTVAAVMEGTVDLKVEHLQYTVSIYPRARAIDLVNQIGFVAALCPSSPRPSSIRSVSTSAPSSVGPGRASLMQLTPWPEPHLPPNGRPASLAPDFRGHGPPSHLRPDGSVRPFVSRPISADSSSLYSHSQYQGEGSPHPASRSEMGHAAGTSSPNRRPFSMISASSQTQGQNQPQTQPVVNLASDMKRLSFKPFGGPVQREEVGTPLSLTQSRGSVGTPEQGRVIQGYFDEKRAVLENPSIRSRQSPGMSTANLEPEESGSRNLPPPAQSSSSSASNRASMDRDRWSSAEEEKKRLFEEARRRAATTQMGGGGNLTSMGLEPPPAYSAPQGSTVAQGAFLQAQEAKEREKPLIEAEKRRSAQLKLDQGRFSPVPTTAAIPVREKHTSTGSGVEASPVSDLGHVSRSGAASPALNRGSNGALPDYTQGSVGSSASRSGHDAPAVTLSEKEQMRRFYEARARVAETQGNAVAGSSSAVPQSAGSSSGHTDLTEDPASFSTSRKYMTAQEEKDLMRKRYEEATRATAAFQTMPPAPSSPSGPRSRYSHPHSYESQSSGPSSAGSGLLAQHPSAEQEKELMRRRYEEATQQANATQGALASGSGGGSSSQYVEVGGSSGRQDKGKAANSPALEDAPPLPPRPPAEYQQLLSPVLETQPMMAPQMIYPGYYPYGMMMQSGGPARFGYG